jgi:hypothetical protein
MFESSVIGFIMYFSFEVTNGIEHNYVKNDTVTMQSSIILFISYFIFEVSDMVKNDYGQNDTLTM